MTDAKTKQPSPAVLVHGPAGSGKSALIDQMVKFFETTSVEDGYTLPPPKGDGIGENCRWHNLKPGVLYITNEAFTEMDMLHAGMGHGIYVVSVWDVYADLGAARGRTMAELTTERFLSAMLNDAMQMGGPRRGGGAPRQPR